MPYIVILLNYKKTRTGTALENKCAGNWALTSQIFHPHTSITPILSNLSKTCTPPYKMEVLHTGCDIMTNR